MDTLHPAEKLAYDCIKLRSELRQCPTIFKNGYEVARSIEDLINTRDANFAFFDARKAAMDALSEYYKLEPEKAAKLYSQVDHLPPPPHLPPAP